jgi:hypothetical protein
MKTAILVIHGIGNQTHNFADDFSKMILDKSSEQKLKFSLVFGKI